MKPLIKEAKRLQETDMDRYWLFCYEVLSTDLIEGEWKDMKRYEVSFIKKGVI